MASTSMERALLEELDARGPVTVVALAEATELHPTTVEQCCYDLHRDGYVHTTTSGVYDLTDAGRQYLTNLPE